jgi:hypothetical protein
MVEIVIQKISPVSVPTIASSDDLWAEFGYVVQIIFIPQQQQRVIFQPLSKDRYLQVFTYSLPARRPCKKLKWLSREK